MSKTLFLFNNAGKLSLVPILDCSVEEFTETMNVNVTSAFVLTKLVAPVMKEKGEGHIINTSSVAGCAAHWGPVAYSTSKHAMNGLTKAMANELGPEIHVNGIQKDSSFIDGQLIRVDGGVDI